MVESDGKNEGAGVVKVTSAGLTTKPFKDLERDQNKPLIKREAQPILSWGKPGELKVPDAG